MTSADQLLSKLKEEAACVWHLQFNDDCPGCIHTLARRIEACLLMGEAAAESGCPQCLCHFDVEFKHFEGNLEDEFPDGWYHPITYKGPTFYMPCEASTIRTLISEIKEKS